MTPQTAAAIRALIAKWRHGNETELSSEYYYRQKLADELAAVLTQEGADSFQSRVGDWMLACFGEPIASDKVERNHRFLEEALELVQALGCTASEAHQLVDYTFGRPVGEPSQETGGVMVTLAALCRANGIDMQAAAETELARIWTKVEAIRAKQAAKPKHSPLPASPAEPRAAEGAGTVCVQCGDTGRVTDTNNVTWPCAWCSVNKERTAAAAVPAGGDAVAEVLTHDNALNVRWLTCELLPIGTKLYTAPAPRGGVTEESLRLAMKHYLDVHCSVQVCKRILEFATPPAAQAQDAGEPK